MAVRAGVEKPDISTPEAFKRALLSAKSITYLNPKDGGASGIHFTKVLARLAIADEMKARTIFAPKADALAAMVASGEAQIGVIQYQFLHGGSGIEIIGPLPGDLQNATVFSAAIMGASLEAEASKAFVTYLRTAEGAAVIKAKGMEPASK